MSMLMKNNDKQSFTSNAFILFSMYRVYLVLVAK